MHSIKRYKDNTIWLIIALCLVSRIPLLTSPNMLLDGDESVVGLMAKHLYDRQELSLYFYGQRYGFSLIEELCILPFYAAMGMTGLAVKLAMLSLWTTGVVFTYKTLLRLNKAGGVLPLLLTLLLIVCPAWTEWSMKARGGYLTAFTLSAILVYLLFDEERKLKPATYMLVGLLMAVLYESMPLWVPLPAMLLLYRLIKDFSIAKLLSVIVTIALPLVLLGIHKQSLYEFHKPDPTLSMADWWQNIVRIPSFLYVSLHGFHSYYTELQPTLFQKIFAAGFMLLMLTTIILAVIKIVKGRYNDVSIIILTTSIIISLFVTIMTPFPNYRFMLPVTVEVLLLMQMVWGSRKPKLIPILLLIPIGVGSLFTFRQLKFTALTEKNILQASDYLQKNQIKHVYSLHMYLAWQMNFYSQGKVLCRDVAPVGRIPELFTEIDNALKAGKHTAVIGVDNDFGSLYITKPVVMDVIYIKENVPISEVQKGFAIAP
jgi:hypothetical protein